jgi:hypothetical protein
MPKAIYVFAFTALLSTSTFAGTMRDWVEYVYPKINTPLIDTLEIYRTEGFILIDVGANYAAYSSSAERLTLDQRKNKTSVTDDASLVIQYNSCPPQSGWLSGKINYAAVAIKIDDASELAEEIRELLLFIESNKATPWGVGVSPAKEDQSYIGFNDPEGNKIEMQINQFPHQIKFQIIRDTEC